ncbi:MAG TPA: GNAT family N-acetyltransferase [Galbitalea sp.]|jgi:ribosomal protein S18 acetylase RimI-like enzyme|nr:GNAT family N-acetyltransferase [Galbitalea sp.]
MADEETRVRAATLADASGIARVHVNSWRETYAELVPGRFFSESAFGRRKTWWTERLSENPRFGTIFVALRGNAIIGFASAGPAVGSDVEKGHPAVRETHLYTIYLLASEHGAGVGRSLLQNVIGEAPAQLWVAAGNARAIAFYERNGFRADGVEVTDPAIEGLVEIRMVR